MTRKQFLGWVNDKGGNVQAAAYLGVSTVTIWRWSKRPDKIPKATLMLIINEMTGKK